VTRQVAHDLGLPPWWLNEQATAYISGKDDPGKRGFSTIRACG
jgi:hypothetical protein